MTNKSENQIVRPPIVVILGHVDHGKTKILDYIRKTKVAEGESGGITQHIGAYQVEQNEKKITFLDTPGHEAFSALRSRGTKVADIAILVVAADEGIKPQTKEAISILKKEEIPYVVAINKIDKDTAEPQKVKSGLAEEEVLIEEWGGKIPAVEISAKMGQGMDELLDMILLLAELEELKADTKADAQGVVVESKLDNKRGLIATLLVKNGTLKKGDIVVSGNSICKVRSLEDFTFKQIDEADPSSAAVTTGWDSAPHLGGEFVVVNSPAEAKKLAKENTELALPLLFVTETGAQDGEKKILKIVIKADVFSSLEAVDQVLKTIHSDEVGYAVLASGVGNITEGDVVSVAKDQGKIYGFRVQPVISAEVLAQREGVEIHTYDVIYEMIEDIKKELSAMLDPEIQRNPLGKAKVLATFKTTDRFQIVGGKVMSGKIVRGAMLEVMRGGNPVFQGKITQLQHNKADVEEITEGLEFGIKFEGPQEVQEGDILEIYQEEEITQSL
jgi:translation initiation factor IF-2